MTVRRQRFPLTSWQVELFWPQGLGQCGHVRVEGTVEQGLGERGGGCKEQAHSRPERPDHSIKEKKTGQSPYRMSLSLNRLMLSHNKTQFLHFG